MKEYLYDVFLSFTGADRELKNRIKEHLSSIGLSFYDSDLYCKGQFRQDFCEALDKSRVYLMILTDNLRNDPAVTGTGTLSEVRRECSLACQLEAANELNIVILCTSEFFKFSNSYHDYNDAIGWFFYSHTRGFSQVWGAPNENGELAASTLDEIGSRCLSFVEARKEGKPQISQKPKLDIAENKLPERGVFVGRDEEIGKALDAFSVGKQAVVLYGMGGIGKTELAIEIARRCEQQNYLKCPQIVHISDYNDSSDLLYSLSSFVSYSPSVYAQIGPLCERDKYERKLRALADLPETVLLVIDNCNNLTEDELRIAISTLKCRLLITTRAEIEDINETVSLIGVSYLEEELAYQMFISVSNREIEREKFSLLYSEVGGHTITLCIMAKLMRVHGMTVESLLADMDEMSRFDAKVDFRHNESGDSKTVLEHLQSLFKISKLSAGATDILRSMSLISGGSISVEALMQVLGLKNRNGIIELTSNGWLELRVRVLEDKTSEELYLHPILSRLMVSILEPTEENSAAMIDYIITDADNSKQNLTYKGAVFLEDRLFYACYVLAGVTHRLSDELWSRFVSVNRLLGDTEGTAKRVAKLSARLSDGAEQSVVTAYGDMITIEQYPTRVDILEKYLDKLVDNSANYKWVLRSLSVTYSHILGLERYRAFLARATEAAFYAAIEREDDFAVFDLLDYVTTSGDKPKKYVKDAMKYVKRRQKAGNKNGSLEYICIYCDWLISNNYDKRGIISASAKVLIDAGNEKYSTFLKMALTHPICYFRSLSSYSKVEKLDDENDPVATALKLMYGATDDFAFEGQLDAAKIIEAAVKIHTHRLERNTTLQSASVAALGVISLLRSLPEAMVKADVARLAEGVDMNNLSVVSVSNLQVAALINGAFGNSEAVNQSRQLVEILRRLRPEGHNDIITAVISYADVCAAFGKDKEALRNYYRALSDMRKKDNDSVRQREIAGKMIKLSALSAFDFSQIEFIKDAAISGYSPDQSEYWDCIRNYTVRLIEKAKAERLSFSGAELGAVIRLVQKEISSSEMRSALVQRAILYTACELAYSLAQACEFELAEKIILLIGELSRKTRGQVKADCIVRKLISESLIAFYRRDEDHVLRRKRVVSECVKRHVFISDACVCCQMAINTLDFSGFDDLVASFVKGKKAVKALRLLADEYISLAALYGVEISDLELAARIKKTGGEYWRSSYGIKAKDFRRMRSAEKYYITVFTNIINYMIENFTPPASDLPKVSVKPEMLVKRYTSSDKTGMNDPCPCGSGKKYKKCCGIRSSSEQ